MPETLSSFLEGFPARTAESLRERAARSTTIVDETSRQFRLDPSAGLASIREQITALRNSDAADEVIWCYAGDSSHGLDDFELAAILGRWLHVESAHQAVSASGKRVAIAGRLRRELIAVTFVADRPDSDLLRFLASCADSRLPALVLLAASRLEHVAADSELCDALRRHEHGGGGVAMSISNADTDSALADPLAHLRPFERSGLHVRLVKFERGAAIEPGALDRFMRSTGLACDMSLPTASRSGDDWNRSGAYSGAAPYRPQPFDLRVPWFHTEPTMWIELPAINATGSFEEEFRDCLRGTADDELVKRLDTNRMAAFYRASAISPELERDYPQYRIYNWPRSAPARRVWLLNVGAATTERKREVESVLARLADPRTTIVTQDDLIDAARAEVVERYGLSSAAAIDRQAATHAYLADIPRYGALRQDYADFVRFAPAQLGATLEIGSGYGVLAWALSTRARRYVCADLDANMFRGLRRDLGQAGVVADAHQMPFVDGAFDSIVANNVIEHFYDPLSGLREIRRVLRPGGRLLALMPFDALENRYELPAHLWKIDESGLRGALSAAGLTIARLEIVDLQELGVPGAFPSCHGLAAMVDAQRPLAGDATSAASTVRRGTARLPKPASERAGRVWPSVRELVRFEQWNGKQVVAVGADAEDVNEFRHFGANVIEVPGNAANWAVLDGAADLVYLFLSASRAQLPHLTAEIRRVLTPNGAAVAVFRNRGGLRHLARVGSYFGAACELEALAGADAVARLADDDRAPGPDGYVTIEDIDGSFHQFKQRNVSVNNLAPEDLAADVGGGYPEGFWDWLAASCGRFVMVRAQR